MKNRIVKLLAFILALGAAASASAVNVTFRVNMGVQVAMSQFNAATDFMYVAGDTLNNWSENTTLLTQSVEDTNIWEVTVDLAAGSFPNYKFVKQRFGVGFVWEDDGVGPNGNQNRWFQVPATGTNLPAVYFNNLSQVIANHAPVTFQVNMSVQTAQGAFNPASSTLLLAGSFTAWENNPVALTQSITDTNIWECTVDITNNVGASLPYKFIMDGNWETIANRTFIMTNVTQTLPAVYFNNVTNVAIPIPVTFSVNMGVALARGAFNPGGGDYLEAYGSFNTGAGGAWLGGSILTNTPANPVVYSGTYTTTNAPGGNMLYQFVINGSTWESTGNRQHVFANTNAVILPTAFLNDVATLGPLTNAPASATSASLSWQAGPLVRVQTSTNLTGPWQNVDGTEGQSSTTAPVGPEQTYFRLIGP
jgi:hypothetical protein